MRDPTDVVTAAMQHPDATEALVERAGRGREGHAQADTGELRPLGINPLLLQQPGQGKRRGRRGIEKRTLHRRNGVYRLPESVEVLAAIVRIVNRRKGNAICVSDEVYRILARFLPAEDEHKGQSLCNVDLGPQHTHVDFETGGRSKANRVTAIGRPLFLNDFGVDQRAGTLEEVVIARNSKINAVRGNDDQQ